MSSEVLTTQSATTTTRLDGAAVRLRRLPHPYKAMLAICSDLDETPDRRVYREIMRFLNTTDTTSMGEGLGLEVGNSIYFDMPPDQFAYWNTDDAGRAMVREWIRSGHVDCLHSYGDLATTREHAGRALDELDRHGLKLSTWVDHGTAVTNFGADIMQGHGDQPDHPAYHADLTLGAGVRYLWLGRVSSVIGQDVDRRLGGVFSACHPVASAITVTKEAAKGLLARLGSRKYRIHRHNQVLQPCLLRDGQAGREFLRCNPHWGGVSSCETGRGIGQVLTDRMLATLTDREGICVLYTHLGKVVSPDRPFDDSGTAGFRRMADAHRAGRVLVTTTTRLLRYVETRDSLEWTVRREGDTLVIDARMAEDGSADGLTFEATAVQCRLVVNGRAVETRREGPLGGTPQEVWTVPWRRLELPPIE